MKHEPISYLDIYAMGERVGEWGREGLLFALFTQLHLFTQWKGKDRFCRPMFVTKFLAGLSSFIYFCLCAKWDADRTWTWTVTVLSIDRPQSVVKECSLMEQNIFSYQEFRQLYGLTCPHCSTKLNRI